MALRLFPDRHLSDRFFPNHPFPDLHRDIHIPRQVHRDIHSTFISLNLYELVGECVGRGNLQLYELVGILVMVGINVESGKSQSDKR